MSLGVLKKFNFYEQEVLDQHDIPLNITCSLVLRNWSVVFGCADGQIVAIDQAGAMMWTVRLLFRGTDLCVRCGLRNRAVPLAVGLFFDVQVAPICRYCFKKSWAITWSLCKSPKLVQTLRTSTKVVGGWTPNTALQDSLAAGQVRQDRSRGNRIPC